MALQRAFLFEEENLQNYGWCTTQNLMQKPIQTITDFATSMPVYILSLMNFINNKQEIFHKIHLYAILKKEISIIFIDQMPTYIVFLKKSTLCSGITIFNILPTSVTIVKNDKVKFQATLRKYLHAHCFYSVDNFLCVKMIYYTVFVKCL